jgi:death-on-curing protein
VADGIRQAAYLFQGLLMNQGFVQGNKRTAYALLEWFLSVNGLGLVHADDDAVVASVAAENDKWTIEEIDRWLRLNVTE